MPVSKPMSYYMQQIKTLTTSIQLVRAGHLRMKMCPSSLSLMCWRVPSA